MNVALNRQGEPGRVALDYVGHQVRFESRSGPWQPPLGMAPRRARPRQFEEAAWKPLVPIEVDLRDFAFMPLDVVRLRDSDLVTKSTGDQFRCAVMLWCASWHQVPAASLPDDDDVLAQLAGFGRVVKEWRKVRAGSLRGWILCDDGRLYHPVVAEKALDAWKAKQRQRWSTAMAALKKYCQRHAAPYQPIPFEDWLDAGCPEGQALYVPGTSPGMSRGHEPDVPGTTPQCPLLIQSKGQG